MKTRFLMLVAVGLGVGSALGTASCGPTCPASQPNCTTTGDGYGSIAGSAGAAGAAGSSATCDQLTSLRACMTAFCATASNPFCNCYTKGFDLGAKCSCVTFDAQRFCDTQASTGAEYDCSAATSAVASTCVGVQQ